MALYGTGTSSPVFDDTSVDELQDTTPGVIDSLPALSIDIPDSVITNNLERRIQDSQTYWNKSEGFNLDHNRNENLRLYLGKHIDTSRLYKYQTPYIENQIYIGVNAIIAYLTARTPAPECYPAKNAPEYTNFALSLEKALTAWLQQVDFDEKQEDVVRNTLIKRVGFLKFRFDPDLGTNGRVVIDVVDPRHIIVDKNAKMGDNPSFICQMLKMSVNEILSRWPEKKEEVFDYCGFKRGTQKQLDTILTVREVWLTHYDAQFRKQESVVYYTGNVVLDKCKDPNWIYADEHLNFLPYHMKPFLPLNFDNDGAHWIDYTTAVEQARIPQETLNKRGRQLMEAADKANGLLVVSADSGLTKDDLQNLTGDPNQRLIIKTNGQNVDQLVHQIPPQQISPVLMQDKQDQRMQLHAIMGTPSEFTGSDDGSDGEETLGQSQMKKNQASGRQDLYVRSIDRFNARVMNYAVQMFAVWYTEGEDFVANGGDGEFDYVTMARHLIKRGTIVTVKSGANLPFDKTREEHIGLELLKMQVISPLDGYKMLHIPNAQQVYDNFAKFNTDPMELARTGLDELDSARAYTAYADIMSGRKLEDPDDVDTEFVLTMRKLMLRDDFLKASRKQQNALMDFVKKAIDSLDARKNLDELAKQGADALDPSKPTPIAPPEAPAGPAMPQPGAPGVPAPAGQSPVGMPMNPGELSPVMQQGAPAPAPMPQVPGVPQVGLPPAPQM